ncbi:phosphoribosylglycinamide formyltransferase [Marinibacterium profundimaris]|uniref:Phosphoribosylglycinamide formyltransferase n=1 Tax=Marinibacterium profundimaris TaxID=1679460 RepID=A0A225NGM7_9RHOB|nr:phosphoribosylglycinamide formyltransferase [Marinibacterium profundimaris]OWU72647.1 phosphoribosylglycinamide formyltransferase [Marinibacterium profundimaris]
MSGARVAILISGGGTNMAALVDSMGEDHPGRPVLVVSNRADAGGLEKARARGVETVVVDHRGFADRESFEAAVTAELEKAEADVVCLAGFMRVLTQSFVSRWEGRILNVHPSLLPKHRGLNTYARALAAGDTEYGATVHVVTAELDDGPILGQVRLPIEPGDTAEEMKARLGPWEHRLYVAVLRRFAGGEPGVVQLP